jgi:hypothetical protein
MAGFAVTTEDSRLYTILQIRDNNATLLASVLLDSNLVRRLNEIASDTPVVFSSPSWVLHLQ